MFWGVDLGGTKIEGIVMTGKTAGSVIARKRIDTEATGGYDHILKRIKSLIDDLIQETAIRPDLIGFGTPGTLDPQTQTLKNSNTLCLNDKHFRSDLEKILNTKIEIANDAN